MGYQHYRKFYDWPYLMQFACFDCRKSFKRKLSTIRVRKTPPRCPDCGAETIEMGRAFKAPKQTDSKQWKKVEALVQRGITFHSYGSHGWGRFPRVPREVAPFLEKVVGKTKGQKLLDKVPAKRRKSISAE